MQRHPQTSHPSVTQEKKPAAKPRHLLLRSAVLRPALLFLALVLGLGYYMLDLFGGGSPAIASEHQGTTPAVIELFTSQGLL